ncbi:MULTISPECIES: DUF3325 domain-containing protein [Pseudomonas]|jgi:hypothetical protein|uniref:DUF3325 domain-containing protein n=1 Tax=Pseudomonas syringae TaxID=317 RepID=A0A085V4H6_PSESX|nr:MULTISPECIES: DUF3325 domain-containing protein [Pseudomonas]EPJ75512.1 hypothetical protein CFII64_29114 [Pseudomonas sp. CFII64]KFE50339.1 hypothetical protein IV02_17240 [Pseudomonas syringae]
MLLASLLCFLGFTGLCLSMTKHYGELLHSKLSITRGRWLRVAGWLALVLSLWPAISTAGWGFGLVQWCTALMTSALILLFLIPYRPKLVLLLAAVGLLLTPFVAFSQLGN